MTHTYRMNEYNLITWESNDGIVFINKEILIYKNKKTKLIKYSDLNKLQFLEKKKNEINWILDYYKINFKNFNIPQILDFGISSENLDKTFVEYKCKNISIKKNINKIEISSTDTNILLYYLIVHFKHFSPQDYTYKFNKKKISNDTNIIDILNIIKYSQTVYITSDNIDDMDTFLNIKIII